MKNNKFDYTHPNTVWEIIRNQIEIDIISNVYKTGEKIPSTNDFAKKYNVSVNTAGKALDFLKNENIIMKRKGIGFFVLPYAKQKIVKLLKEDFEGKVYNTVSMAKILGYDKEEIISFVSVLWDSEE